MTLIKSGASEFLYQSFINRSTSFHSSLGKIAITGSMTRIHQSRVDLKKVFALLSFFDLLNAKGFNYKESSGVFRKIYKLSGEIREYQVNIIYLESIKDEHPGLLKLIHHFNKLRQKCLRGLITQISDFKERKFKKMKREIRLWLPGIEEEVIIDKAVSFLNQRSIWMEKLADEPEQEETLHRIRIELKKIIAIFTLLDQINPIEERKRMFRELDKFESEIGNWHDKIILLNHSRKFIQSHTTTNELPKTDLEWFCKKLESEARIASCHFSGMTRVVSNLVRYHLKFHDIKSVL
ncbi:MAG: CHAD domain-containing protein [Bacteroidota bacterium]